MSRYPAILCVTAIFPKNILQIEFQFQTLTEKSGKHAGCMMWPGSNFTYANTSCTHSTAHNHTTNWLQKIDEIMTWFKDPEKPASLVMLYNDQPDFNAHIFSPNSPLVFYFRNF